MRWKKKKPRHGQERMVRFFAILPVTCEDETRWLEWVIVRQVYQLRRDILHRSYWVNMGFDTEEGLVLYRNRMKSGGIV